MHVWGTFDLVVFSVILGSLAHLSCNLRTYACNSKSAGSRVKQANIWDSGTRVTYITYI